MREVNRQKSVKKYSLWFWTFLKDVIIKSSEQRNFIELWENVKMKGAARSDSIKLGKDIKMKGAARSEQIKICKKYSLWFWSFLKDGKMHGTAQSDLIKFWKDIKMKGAAERCKDIKIKGPAQSEQIKICKKYSLWFWTFLKDVKIKNAAWIDLIQLWENVKIKDTA